MSLRVKFEIDIAAKPFESDMNLTFKLDHTFEGQPFLPKGFMSVTWV